jgi:lysophospholipase L1-like esterase
LLSDDGFGGDMSRAGRARRIAVAGAYGGGGAGAMGALLYGLLKEQAKRAQRNVGPAVGTPPDGDGMWGHGHGEPVRLAVLGDSGAAGFGVEKAIETPGVLIASGLSELAGKPVLLTNVATVGATSTDLERQVGLAVPTRPEVALIIVGTNDVKERMRPGDSVRHLVAAVRALRATGAEVVVGTCPDLGTIRPVAQPLRTFARYWSRQLAAAQTVAVVEAGGITVSLGDILGPEFAARPAEMFSPDRFHPSAEGYAAAAAVLLPSVARAVGHWPEEAEPVRPFRDRARPVARAAAKAAGHPGTEVAPTEVRGRERGPRGRWAVPLRRRPHLVPEPSMSDHSPHPDADDPGPAGHPGRSDDDARHGDPA